MNAIQVCELGLTSEEEQLLRIWNLTEDLNAGLKGYEPWWWVDMTVYHAIADWHDEGHPISFDQLVQEILLRT